MKFHEVKFVCPPGMDAGDVEAMANGAAERADDVVEVLGVTVHQRPHAAPVTWGEVACVMVMTDDRSVDHDAFNAFGGAMTRDYGLPFEDAVQFGENTLSLKGDPDAIEAFLADALGTDRFSVALPDDDADTFVVEGSDDE